MSSTLQRPRQFQPCVADGRLFPLKAWSRKISRVARRSPSSLVTLDHPFGDVRLREAIAAHVAEWRGVSACAEQIIVTAGTGDAIRLILEVLGKPGMKIGLENPGYLPVRQTVSRLGLSPEWLSIGAEGAALPSDRCSMAVLTPSFQFPLGGAMPLERRSAFLAWAKKNNSWIIEDDYDSEFRYGGQPIPAMAGLDRGGRAIYVGTFSKTFSPDIRIGYLIIPDDLMDLMTSTLSERPSNASLVPQRVLAEFIEDGAFHRHLRRVRRHYAQRRDALLDLVEGSLGPQPQARALKGGMQIAVEMPHEIDDRKASRVAATDGLGPEPLSKYDAGQTRSTGLLMGFCAHSPEEMKDGFPSLVRLLGM
ncbi:MAG: PLP-dependent aminotransferase family protein [Ruegeria sp.]